MLSKTHFNIILSDMDKS